MLNHRLKRKVLCLVPPTGLMVREDRCQTPIENLKTIALRPPIDLMYSAAAFEKAGCDVVLADYPAEGWGWDKLGRQLLELTPSDVLVSITTVSLSKDLEAISFIKQHIAQARLIAKGAHFNTLDVEVLRSTPALDVVIRGEVENTCFELGLNKELKEIPGITWREPNGNITKNIDRFFEQDLDSLPLPARHLSNNLLYVRPDTGEVQTTLVTNRGCPYHCTYCLANQVAGTKNRHRSVNSIISEIKHCISSHNIKNFLFRSELFTQNEKWVLELCAAILENRLKISWACNSRVDTITATMLKAMKDAGCWIMALGVESGEQETLDRVGKRAKVQDAFAAIQLLRSAKIKSSVYLMIGFPWDTRESIANQSKFALALDPDLLEVFYPYPFPGTEIRSLAQAQGLIASSEFPAQAYSTPVMPTETLSIADLRRARLMILRHFYLRPKIITRTLIQARTPKEFINYINVGAAQLKSILAA